MSTLTIPASSLATLTDSSVLPSALRTTQTQWWVLPTSIPTHALSLTAATRASPFVGRGGDHGPVEHPADASVTSDRAQISISSQGTPESRADIPSKRHHARRSKPHPALLGRAQSYGGDLIMGAVGCGAIGTLVERRTRFTILLHLPDGHKPPMRSPRR